MVTSYVNDEVFRLELAGQEVPIAKNYQVDSGILSVPAGFSMEVGHSGVVAEIMRHYPMFTPFALYVGDTKVMSGEVDRLELTGSGGSSVKITGRDMLKWLADSYIDADRTFAEQTFLDLTKTALKECGISSPVVALDGAANRKAITGQSVSTVSVTTETAEGGSETERKKTKNTLKAEYGTKWWDFLVEQYRRAGLFLWATPSGGFVLSRPNGLQQPLTRIHRRRNPDLMQPGDVTVLGQPEFFEDATERYTECRVAGRSGGKKSGRGRVEGRYIDEEMVKNLNPLEADQADGGKRKKALIVKDQLVSTTEQANYLARRKIAESRRNGWSLAYSVSGHTAPAIGGGTVIWQPDTVTHVIDEELGIDEPMWIESCRYSRSPKTTTRLRLMRIVDLIFAEEDDPKLPPPRRRVRVGKTEKLVWSRDPQLGNLPVAKWQQEGGLLVPAQNSDFTNGTATPLRDQ